MKTFARATHKVNPAGTKILREMFSKGFGIRSKKFLHTQDEASRTTRIAAELSKLAL